MDLRYPPLSPTAAPMIVHQNSVCVSLSLGPLKVGLPLILVNPNPGIAESVLAQPQALLQSLGTSDSPSVL